MGQQASKTAGQAASRVGKKVGEEVANAAQKNTAAAAAAATSGRGVGQGGAAVGGGGFPASDMTGFTRGHGRMHPRDMEQRQFLLNRQRQKASKARSEAASRTGGGRGVIAPETFRADDDDDEYKEMPPDLIQFLQDAGPLKPGKKPCSKDDNDDASDAKDKTPAGKGAATSKRLPRYLRDDDGNDAGDDGASVRDGHQSPATVSEGDSAKDGRVVTSTRLQSMRLAERVEGVETMRNTNFSYREDVVDPGQFASGDVVDMYDLLRRHRSREHDGDGMSVEESVRSFYDRHSHETWTDREKDRHTRMLRRTMESIELPVIMRDTDGSYVGASEERVEELRVIRLVEVSNTKIKLVLEDLSDIEKHRVKTNAT